MVRVFLLIPAILLFLSNIPFIQERDMKVMRASSNDECWMKNVRMDGVCHKPPAKEESSKDEHCPRAKTETTCICISCFQFSAPDPSLINFDNSETSLQITYSPELDQHWINPFLSEPWQPPDFV